MGNDTRIIEMSNKFAEEESHAFLAEGLLVPGLNQSNGNRLQMFNSHVSQTIQIENAQIPKVYTGFENQISVYSTGYDKVAEGKKFKILKKIIKNPCKYILLVQDENSGEYDVIFRTEAEHLTEEFGYKLHNDKIDSLSEDEIIEENTVLSYDNCFTPEMNFKYGTNMKIAYLPYKGSTNEDGLVISESAAKKMSSWFVKKVTVSINTNDIPLNIYGTKDTYKSFPNVGENVKEDGRLMVTRRISHDTIINNFRDELMRQVKKDDKPYQVHNNAKVIDIDMWSNNRTDSLHKEFYNTQLADVHDNLMRYYKEIVDYLEPIMNNSDNKLSPDLIALYNEVYSYMDPLSEFENDGKKFEHVIMNFYVLYLSPLNIGSKLTARYGNKGVISKIVPDEEMPVITSVRGSSDRPELLNKLFRADMCVNPFGVFNRLNISQCVEMELNYLANLVRYTIDGMSDIKEKEELLFKFLSMTDPKKVNYEIYKTIYDGFEDKEEFFKNIVDEGMSFREPPFWGNINSFGVYDIYKELGFDLEPNNLTINKIPIGEIYYIRLKHEPGDKLSARSSSNNSMSGLPTKTQNSKKSITKISDTPIRIGEMETANLGMVGTLKPVSDLLMSYANSPKARMKLILSLLNGKPFELKTPEVNTKDSNNKKILKSYLKALGVEFVADNSFSEIEEIVNGLENKDLLILAAEIETLKDDFDIYKFRDELDLLREEYGIDEYLEEIGWNDEESEEESKDFND